MRSILTFHRRIFLITCVFVLFFQWQTCRAQPTGTAPAEVYEPGPDDDSGIYVPSDMPQAPAAAMPREPVSVDVESKENVVISVTAPIVHHLNTADDRYAALTNRIGEIRNIPRETTAIEPAHSVRSSGLGKLQDLERKRFESNSLRVDIGKRDSRIKELMDLLGETLAFTEEQRLLISMLNGKITILSNQIVELQKKIDSHNKTLDLLRLGDFEYYEVKEGDTCKSIAANPLIYNDASKEQYIRQANRGHIDDLDILVPGQMLIIPRFPTSGRYEF